MLPGVSPIACSLQTWGRTEGITERTLVRSASDVRRDTVRSGCSRVVRQSGPGASGGSHRGSSVTGGGHGALRQEESCFACHNQAYPALALSAAQTRGFAVPGLLARQGEHIAEFLASNKKEFLAGKGTGGQAATAAYALFTLELVGHEPDDTTAAVAQYLLGFEPNRDHWRTTSNRPPTEASDFTTTYVAMRALRTYGAKLDQEKIAKRVESARELVIRTRTKETEDRVFRLLGLKEARAGEKEIAAAAWELISTQHADGGWSQLDGGTSDPYATGSASSQCTKPVDSRPIPRPTRRGWRF